MPLRNAMPMTQWVCTVRYAHSCSRVIVLIKKEDMPEFDLVEAQVTLVRTLISSTTISLVLLNSNS
jgi:hypothetical protein